MTKPDNLGNELFLLMVNLTQVRDRERVVELFTEALSSLFNGMQFRFTTSEETETNNSIEVATSTMKLGRIAIKGPLTTLTADTVALIRNSVRMLALILENRFQAEVLVREKDGLEMAVAARTADLLYVNQNLQKQILERQRAEDKLKGKTEELELYFSTSLDLLCIADKDGYFRRLNPEWEKTLGYTLSELEGKRFLEFVHPDDLDKTFAAASELKEQSEVLNFENRCRTKDGSYRWIEWRAHLKGKLIYAAARDITKRKEIEEALRESEERFRVLAEGAFEGVLISRDGVILDANNVFCEMSGYQLEEFVGKNIQDIIQTDFKEITMFHALSGNEEAYESAVIHKDGHVVPVQVKGKLIPYGGATARIASIRDISDRRKAEEVQKRLATAIEQAAEAVLVTDVEGIIQYVNPATEKITGFNSQELIGQTTRVFKSGEHDSTFYKQLWDTIKGGETWSGKFINKRKDGNLFHEEATISPVRDAAGNITNFVAVKRDITQQLEISKQLFQAQKMEAVGTLAGGIAHDFNNLLAVVQGYSELLLSGKTESAPGYKGLAAIRHAAIRGADLVKHLLAFGKKLETKLRPTNVNKEVDKAQKLLSRTIPKMIHLEFDLAPDLWTINADPSQIEQILLNLVINARDSIPEDGGKIVIQTRNVLLGDEYCKKYPKMVPGQFVKIAVSDNGCGMEQEIIDRIFEPFFTTKKSGEGTGLGLAMVFGIVDSHGGHIECQSTPGVGTTFILYFPVIEAVEAMEEKILIQNLPVGTETILLVDDEETILSFGKALLSQAGYHVLAASNGREGVDLYTKHLGKVNLVILDLSMPIMGGRECLRELYKIDPKVKVVIASGYSSETEPSHLDASHEKAFVAKPFGVRDLLETIRKVLDEN